MVEFKLIFEFDQHSSEKLRMGYKIIRKVSNTKKKQLEHFAPY